MGFLTWQNVPVGDLSAAQEGFRTASSLFDRAIRSGQEGIASYQQIQNNEQAFKQQMADKIMAAKMMAIQDPEEYRKAMATGLVDPAIAQNVSLDAMARANKQFDVLQGRAQADQNLLSAKQQFDALGYKINREQEGDRLSDAAMPILNEALKVAVNDRVKALAMIEQSPMQLEDKAKAVAMIDTQYQNRTAERLGWARHAQEQRQFDLLRRAAQLEQKLVEAGGDSIEEGKILNQYAKDDPNLGPVIVKMVKQGLSATNPEFFKEVASLRATGGDAPVDTTGSAHDIAISNFRAYVENAAGKLSSGAKILEKAADPTATAAAIALKLKEEHPDFDTNELTNVINKTREAAKAKGVDITEDVAANMIVNSMQDAGFWNLNNFAKGADLVQGRVEKLIDSYTADQTELNNYRRLLVNKDELATLTAKRAKLAEEEAIALRRKEMGQSNDKLIERIRRNIAKTDKEIIGVVPTLVAAMGRQVAREDVARKEEKDRKESKEKADKADKALKKALGEKNKKDSRIAKKLLEKEGSMFPPLKL